MACQLKNRYSRTECQLLRLLREYVVSPAALLLTGILLLANLVFIYAELHCDEQPRQSAGSSFCSLDSHYDLNSATVESRELRGGREGVENFSPSKLEFESSCQRGEVSLLFGAIDYDLILANASPCSTILCEAPFSPRPPPFVFSQG